MCGCYKVVDKVNYNLVATLLQGCGVGTNSGMDYWNGTLDWTTGLSYFPFLDKFLNSLWKPTFYDL